MARSVRAAALVLSVSLAGMLVPAARGQCVGPGPGGKIPTASGSAGYWPSVLPGLPCQSAQWVDVPPGATHLSGVLLYDLFHSALGEVQVVLHSPSGVAYNIFPPVDDAGTSACRDDFTGSLEFVDALRYDPCGTVSEWRACAAGSGRSSDSRRSPSDCGPTERPAFATARSPACPR